MDNIIKYVIIKKYTEVSDYICLLSDNDAHKMLICMISFFINKNINEEQLFIVLYNIVCIKKQYVFMTDNTMDDLYFLIKKIKETPDDNSLILYRFLISYEKYLVFRMRCESIMNNLKQGKTKKIFSDCHDLKSFKYQYDTDFRQYLHIFDDSAFLNAAITPANRSELSHNCWKETHEIELEARLKNIVSKLGLIVLTFINVHIITVSEFNCMEYKDKIMYYTKTLSDIRKGYNNISFLLERYEASTRELDDFDIVYKSILNPDLIYDDDLSLSDDFKKYDEELDNENVYRIVSEFLS